MVGWFDDRDPRRALGTRERKILYERANHQCEVCDKALDYLEMLVGHKTAWSKGGKTTLANSVCLCYKCNNLQWTDSWTTILKKLGKEEPKSNVKQMLDALTVQELKSLAKEHLVKVKGKVVEDLIGTSRRAPTKAQYVSRLSKVVTEQELRKLRRTPSKPTTAPKKRPSA